MLPKEKRMALTRVQVQHIAELAKLKLSDDEIDRMTQQLSAILDHAARLQTLNTEAIPPTASVLPLQNVMRDDRVAPSLPREQVIANAPDQSEDGEFFRVRAILKE
jgi:aspartyl-tRNA(Asn)/glutamyl-tRNA(Gln) amidotransferase subunit C